MSQDQEPSSYTYSGSQFPQAAALYSHITEQVRNHGNNPNPVHDNNYLVTYSDIDPSWAKDAGFALERLKCFRYYNSITRILKIKATPAPLQNTDQLWYRACEFNWCDNGILSDNEHEFLQHMVITNKYAYSCIHIGFCSAKLNTMY